tara:strand:- start:1514 stop:1735 length:222 start_codon:yes stop_codon:yes gene_type:complete
LYRVARLGAAICGAFDMTCNVRSCSRLRAIASDLLGVRFVNFGLPLDFMARRWARFGLVSIGVSSSLWWQYRQ